MRETRILINGKITQMPHSIDVAASPLKGVVRRIVKYCYNQNSAEKVRKSCNMIILKAILCYHIDTLTIIFMLTVNLSARYINLKAGIVTRNKFVGVEKYRH